MIGEWIDLEGVERRHKYTLCHWLIGGQSLLWVAASLHIPYLLNWNMRPYQIMSCHLNQINRILRTQQETNNWSRNTAWDIIDRWPTDLWSQDFCIISIFHLRYTFLIFRCFMSSSDWKWSNFLKKLLHLRNCVTFLTNRYYIITNRYLS